MSPEQAEAYGVGQSLGAMQTTLGHIADDVKEVRSTTTKTASDVTELKVQLTGHSGRLDGHDRELKELKQLDPIGRAEFTEMKTEMAAGRLTWPKLITAVTALGGLVTAGAGLLLSWAVQLGVFK